MTKNEIKEKYNGYFGVFNHDMYKASDEDYSNGFLTAFEHGRKHSNLPINTEQMQLYILFNRKEIDI